MSSGVALNVILSVLIPGLDMQTLIEHCQTTIKGKDQQMIEGTRQILALTPDGKSARTNRTLNLRATWEPGRPIESDDQYRIARAVSKRLRRVCRKGPAGPPVWKLHEIVKLAIKQWETKGETDDGGRAGTVQRD